MAAKQITVSRIFDAPAEAVWQLWTDPENIKQWWGPDKFTCPLVELDFREGGTSLVAMKARPEMGGQTHYNIWTYTSISPHKRIEFIMNLSDAKGAKQKPTAVGMPADFPEDVRTVVTFESLGPNQTKMTVTESADFGTIAHFAQLGLEQCFQKMVLPRR
ncbi:SRPBCC family protein [Puia sp. P3]|uniref:SRPBCC family protein n=1 Tax=Puia sp. P3 TaxID=3423952 RepID=UPI003D664521